MSWNHPTEPVKPAKKEVPPSMLKGIAAGLAAVVVCIAAFFIFSGGSSNDKARTPAAPKKIKEATPAPAPKGKPKTQEEINIDALRARFPGEIPPGWNKPYHPKAYRPDGSLKRYSRYVHVITNSTPRWAIPLVEQTFTHPADRDVANILMINPGDELVGEVRYDAAFKNRLIASLNTPIVIDEEKDTPAQKDLKEAVIATKKELKQALDRGEDVVALMNDTRKQLEELSLYRQEVKKMVDEAKAANGDKFTKQDEEDLVKAANQMLEERGCKPLVLPSVFLKQVEQMDRGEDPESADQED